MRRESLCHRAVLVTQLAFAGVVLLIPALIFAVPRRPAPAPSLEQPGQALVDRVGEVWPVDAWTMGGVPPRTTSRRPVGDHAGAVESISFRTRARTMRCTSLVPS